jgi:hypothetical protein
MTKPIRAVASSPLVRRKRAVIIAPIPMSGGKWVCVVIDGNMRFQTSAECDNEHDARQWAARTRAHLKRHRDVQVCSRITPNGGAVTPGEKGQDHE